MKRLIFIISILLLSACAPSQTSIQTAIAQTQAAWTPIPSPIPTDTPRPTPTKAPTKAIPTLRPTQTPTTYILETGWCMLDVGDVGGTDPKVHKLCNLDAREQVKLASNQQVEADLENLGGEIEVYCALFSLDGTFITSDVDTVGSGHVICRP